MKEINSDMNEKKQLFVNITASLVALAVNAGISFLLTPFIIENVGTQAYGFVSLANSFINYALIFTIALNSMSGRFIAVSIFRKNYQDANEYYSSTFIANVLLVVVLGVIATFLIWNLNNLVNVDEALLLDVQMLMGALFFNFFITLLSTNLGISYYVKNKLYISSVISMAGVVIRAAVLVLLYSVAPPRIVYVGIGALCVTGITQFANIIYKRKLLPEISIRYGNFHFKKVKELMASGIWNALTKMGTLMTEGLDLLIANLLLGAEFMGILAIVKTLPSLIGTLLTTLSGTFLPKLTQLYAQDEKQAFVINTKQYMKIINTLFSIPIALIIGYGDVFFSLWVPSQNAGFLHTLSIFTILPWAVIGACSVIHNIFAVINRIKINSMLILLTGLLNSGITYILLKTTSAGLYAVVAVGCATSLLRNLLYTVPFGAIYLGRKWTLFFSEVFRSVLAVGVISVLGYLIRQALHIDSWTLLVFYAGLTGLLGLGINWFIMLDKSDREYFRILVMKKIRKNS